MHFLRSLRIVFDFRFGGQPFIIDGKGPSTNYIDTWGEWGQPIVYFRGGI